MSEIQDFLFSLFYSFVYLFFYYRLLCNKLTCRFSPRALVPSFVFTYSFWFLSAFANMFIPNVPLRAPFLALAFISLFIFYRDAIFKRIFWITVGFFITALCEIVTTPFIIILMHTDLASITENSLAHVIGVLFSCFSYGLVIELLIRSKKRLFYDFIKNYFLIILVDVIYMFIIFYFFYYGNMYLSTDTAIALSVFSTFINSVLALFLLRKVTKKSEEIMITNLKLQQIEMEHKQNQDMAIVVENLRALRHDMNNHMSVLQGLLSMEEYKDAKDYLSTITEELSVANSFIFTENKVLSIILNNKLSKAQQFGITFDTELLTSATPFSDSDLCAVLGNILENAIEASSNHDNPYIFFSMKNKNQHLLIQCDNTYSVAPIFENGILLTTKSDKTYHGIGTKTITSIIENYHGSTEFTVDELFHVNITVPL